MSIRTKRLIPHIIEALARDGMNEAWTALWAKETLTALYGEAVVKSEEMEESEEEDKSEKKDAALSSISDEELQSILHFLASASANNSEPDIKAFCNEQLKALENRTSAPDTALWGRMPASKPNLNIEAACLCAHAVSSHEVSTPQSDFFTAVDDLLPSETRGAAMMGETYFNSATYYRNTILDWRQLHANFGGETDHARQTIRAMMAAFALEVPQGKNTSFVNQHWPAFLMAVARPNNDRKNVRQCL